MNDLTDATGLVYNEIDEQKWYDIGVFKKIQSRIAKEKGIKYIEMVANYAVKDLGVLSYIVRFSDFKSLLKRATKSYYAVYNFGDVEIDINDNSAVIRMKDTAFDDYTCTAWKGAFQGMLEITHSIGTVEETQCQLKGSPHCEFRIRWK